VKILFFDGNGLCIFYKRLDKGTFRLPEPLRDGELTVELQERELDDLIAGLATETPQRQKPRRVH